jgi:D-alanyl-D-alanine dipeptidase
MRYAGERNFFKAKLYDDDRAWLLEASARKLARAAENAAGRGYALVVLDAYRPLSVQDLMWRILPDPAFVAPSSRGSIHNRGAAVDVALLYPDGRELPMPSEFDEFSERASHLYTGAEPERLRARDILRACMEEAGFSAYEAEWWHYVDPDTRSYPLLDIPLSCLKAGEGALHV